MYDIKSISVLLGTSGTGKGTRVSQLLRFLETKFSKEEIYFDLEKKSGMKKKQHGIYFEEIDTYFIGTWTISNKSGLESWTSMDYINSLTGKTDESIRLTKEIGRGNIILEGEPMLLSNKYRPEFMAEYYPLNKLMFNIFNYRTREEYDERIIGRSGKKAGEGGWSRNDSYNKVLGKVINEATEIKKGNQTFNFFAGKYNFDAPITIFGENYLNFIGREDLIQEFLDYSKENNTLRKIKINHNKEWL